MIWGFDNLNTGEFEDLEILGFRGFVECEFLKSWWGFEYFYDLRI